MKSKTIIITLFKVAFLPLGGIDDHWQFFLFNPLFAETTRNTTKQVILRATLPQHFITKSGMGFYHRDLKWQKGCFTKVLFPVPHPTNYFLKIMARRFGFYFLDSFSIYHERGDLTLGRKAPNKMDCTHHCFTPELIWPELVLLTQNIKE